MQQMEVFTNAEQFLNSYFFASESTNKLSNKHRLYQFMKALKQLKVYDFLADNDASKHVVDKEIEQMKKKYHQLGKKFLSTTTGCLQSKNVTVRLAGFYLLGDILPLCSHDFFVSLYITWLEIISEVLMVR